MSPKRQALLATLAAAASIAMPSVKAIIANAHNAVACAPEPAADPHTVAVRFTVDDPAALAELEEEADQLRQMDAAYRELRSLRPATVAFANAA